jgi:hypothetical protein
MGELSNIFNSPFTVAIAAMFIPIVAIIGGIWGKAHADRLKSDQRMAMLARGHSLAEIEAVLKPDSDVYGNYKAAKDSNPIRSLGNARRAAVVLVSVGLGLMAFFTALAFVLGNPKIFAGAGVGLIPLLIGFGFVVDYNLQKRELSRFGMEIDTTDR